MARKAITAMINGSLYIDPIDAARANLEAIKEKAKLVLKHDVPIVIAPIQTWMPKTGTEAIMNEVKKDLGIYGTKKHKI